MPTFATTPRFRQDIKDLTPQQRQRFERVVREEFVPDVNSAGFVQGYRSSVSRPRPASSR